MLVRGGWLQQGTLTTTEMVPARNKKKGRKRRSKVMNKRKVMREATRNTEVVFVTPLGKALLSVLKGEEKEIDLKARKAIDNGMLCYHDLDMIQEAINYPSPTSFATATTIASVTTTA
eukprot:CAMPEP_0171318782 /NCGR_PEP_ID=MMETSP0816-20121228/91391_1 /TAXON_ID=420281 /ORGANISM="Proboscia inermis, Strain CCAP1064/1" /LENGTH=117 /DNA_ID=CAMNT_0011813707 /DNA_START=91 /DNA_END=440 /DNA_ORIENTATION=+